MSKVTNNVSAYIKSIGINVTKMARDTGVPYSALYDSLLNNERTRDLRDVEFLAVCAYLGKDPMDFADKRIG